MIGGMMKNFMALAATFGLFLGMPATVQAAAPPTLVCTPGSSGSESISVKAGAIFESVQVTNAAGSTVGIHATLTNPAGTGSLHYSLGTKVLTFPTVTSTTITTPLSAEFLLVESPDSDVMVTLTCNPSSTTSQIFEEIAGNPSTSLAMVREQAQRILIKSVRKYTSSTMVASYKYDHIFNVLDMWLYTEEERLIVLNIVYEEALNNLLKKRRHYLLGVRRPGISSDLLVEYYSEIEKLDAQIEQLAVDYDAARMVNTRAYWAGAETTSAEMAISRAVAASDVMRNSFSLLGYGPTGGFESDVLLASGDNWEISASIVGAVSQTDFAAGAQRSLSGRGTINIVGELAPSLAAGLGLGFGVTSQDGQTLDDHSQHYAADLIISYQLAPRLSLDGGVNFEITNHNYTQGAGSGSGLSYLYGGNIGLGGSTELGEFTFSPTVNLAVDRATQQAITLSDGAIMPGFEETSGTASVGGEFSRQYTVAASSGPIIIEPRVGLDASLTLAHTIPTTGAASTAWSLGAGVSAGVGVKFLDGLNLDLGARLSRTGETIGASATGKVGATF